MRHESLIGGAPPAGRFRWLVAAAFAALVTGCGRTRLFTLDGKTTSARAEGRDMAELVSAGRRSRCKGYVLDWTIGQPSQNQESAHSASYRMRGGLIGGNGSAP